MKLKQVRWNVWKFSTNFYNFNLKRTQVTWSSDKVTYTPVDAVVVAPDYSLVIVLIRITTSTWARSFGQIISTSSFVVWGNTSWRRRPLMSRTEQKHTSEPHHLHLLLNVHNSCLCYSLYKFLASTQKLRRFCGYHYLYWMELSIKSFVGCSVL